MTIKSGKKGKGPLKVEGSLNIQRAAELREALVKLLEDEGNPVVDVAGVEEMDVACLQVIYSAVLTSEDTGKTLTVRDKVSGVCAQAVEAAGLSPFMGNHLSIE